MNLPRHSSEQIAAMSWLERRFWYYVHMLNSYRYMLRGYVRNFQVGGWKAVKLYHKVLRMQLNQSKRIHAIMNSFKIETISPEELDAKMGVRWDRDSRTFKATKK